MFVDLELFVRSLRECYSGWVWNFGVDCDVQYVIVFGDFEMRLLNELPDELASADIDDCQTWGDIFTLLIVGESQLKVATMCLE